MKRQIIKSYIEKFPKLITKKSALAKIIHTNNKHIWESAEACRSSVRSFLKEKDTKETVLVIPDLHLPYEHPKALDFIKKVADKHQPTRIVQIGDVTDGNANNYHEKTPELHSPQRELDITREKIKNWEKEFPKMTITVGNHCRIYARKMVTAGLPKELLKPFKEIWNTPQWDWVEEIVIDGVKYRHGDGCSKAYINACSTGISQIQGHLHSDASIHYRTTYNKTVFGATVGALIDIESLAAAYGRAFRFRPVLGCAIVTEGVKCDLIPMLDK